MMSWRLQSEENTNQILFLSGVQLETKLKIELAGIQLL